MKPVIHWTGGIGKYSVLSQTPSKLILLFLIAKCPQATSLTSTQLQGPVLWLNWWKGGQCHARIKNCIWYPFLYTCPIRTPQRVMVSCHNQYFQSNSIYICRIIIVGQDVDNKSGCAIPITSSNSAISRSAASIHGMPHLSCFLCHPAFSRQLQPRPPPTNWASELCCFPIGWQHPCFVGPQASVC